MLGVLVTTLAVGATASFSSLGYAALLFAVVAYAIYGVFVRKATSCTSAEITYIMLIAGAALFVALAILEASANDRLTRLLSLPFKNGDFLAAVLYQGVACSVAAFFLSNLAIAKIGVNRTTSFVGLSTVVSIFAGALFLGENFTLAQITGTVIILCGVYTAVGKADRRTT